MPNVLLLQLFKCEDVLLFCLYVIIKMNILEF